MQLRYTQSVRTREKVFVATGDSLPEVQTVELDNARLTPALRQFLVQVEKKAAVPDTWDLMTYKAAAWLESVQRATRLELDALPEQLDGLALLEADRARYEAAQAELSALLAEKQQRYDQELTAWLAQWRPRLEEWRTQTPPTSQSALAALPGWLFDPAAITVPDHLARLPRATEAKEVLSALRALADRYRDAKNAAADAEKQRQEAEKADWINQHGSAHLRNAFGSGYDCQRRYVLERAAQEYPAYTVDFNDKATWSERSCPSEAALAEAQRVKGRVVWLTAPPQADTDPREDAFMDDFEPGEAVTVVFLGKYDLVRYPIE